MKQTPFYEIHQSLGGKLVEFAGYEMPVQYSGIIEEHNAVRNSVGVFDVSHMGEFEVAGKDALAFLQKMTLNDVAALFPGRIHYSAMCYEDGGIIDDLLVYQQEKNKYMLVVNAANLQKDFEWLKSHCTGDVKLTDKSDATALLAVQGANSLAVLQKLTKKDISTVPYYHFVTCDLAGMPMILSRTGYTGELGFELYFDAKKETARNVWNAIFEAGKEYGIAPIGLGARDTLRLEMGFCLYGNDIDKTTNPLEAGLGWITKLNKGDFIGKNAVEKIKKAGIKRKLVGLVLPDRSIARHEFAITHQGNVVGKVTSGTFSPSLQKAIAMGYVDVAFSNEGTALSISIRGKNVPVKVVQLPFLKK